VESQPRLFRRGRGRPDVRST